MNPTRSTRRRCASAGFSALGLTALMPFAPITSSTASAADATSPAALTLGAQTDVTAQHMELVETAVGNFAARGVDIDADRLRVLDVVVGTRHELFVLPAGARIAEVRPDGVALQVPTSLPQRGTRAAVVGRAGGPYWKLLSQDCFARWSADGAYIDACWRQSALLDETDTSHTWYSLEYWATAGPSTSLLAAAELGARTTDPSATWSDWSPRSDSTGACSSTSVSVSVLGASIGDTFERCESWDITKPAAPQSLFRNRYSWNQGFPFGSPADREVALSMALRMPQSETLDGYYLTMGLDGA